MASQGGLIPTAQAGHIPNRHPGNPAVVSASHEEAVVHNLTEVAAAVPLVRPVAMAGTDNHILIK